MRNLPQHLAIVPSVNPVSLAEHLALKAEGLGDGATAVFVRFKGAPDSHKWWGPEDFGPGATMITRPPPGDMNNLYLNVSALRPDAAGKLRAKQDYWAGRAAVMIDDIGPGGYISWDALPVSCPPTWTVETSKGCFQGWWIFDEPLTDWSVSQALPLVLQSNPALCKPEGGDPGYTGSMRWGRGGGSVNGKPSRAIDGKPWRVTEECTGREVTLAEFMTAFGIDDLSLRRARKTLANSPEADQKDVQEAADEDPLLPFLRDQGVVLGAPNGSGWVPILCPWLEEHGGSDKSGTAYLLAGKSADGKGGFRCHHSHGDELHRSDLWAWAEAEGWNNPWAVPNAVDEFEALDENGEPVQAMTAHDTARDYCDKIFPTEKALRNCAVKLFNKHYSVLVAGGKTGIAHWAEDPQHPPDVKPRTWGTLALSVSSTADMGILFANRNWLYYSGTGKERKVRALNPFDAWMQHPDRRTKTGLAFGPGADPAALNLHFGPGVTPRPGGDWSLYYRLIEEGICGNEPDPEAAAADLIRLLAWKMQHPGDHSEKIIVLRGSPGAGKTSMASIFEKVLGPSYVQTYTNPQHVFGRFNPEMAHTAVIVLNESFWAGNHQDEASLKAFADTMLLLEMKYGPKLKVPNHALLILLGNADWLIPVREGDRRAVAYNVADRFMQDHDFFKRLWIQMENGGFEALCHHLLNLDLGDWNPRDMKPTKGTQKQRSLSADPIEQWALALADDFAQAWCGLERARSQGGDWVELGSLTTVHSAFKAWAVRGLSRHDKEPGAQELVVGLRKLLGKDTLIKRRPRGNRPWVWSLGLGKMREVLALKFPDHFED